MLAAITVFLAMVSAPSGKPETVVLSGRDGSLRATVRITITDFKRKGHKFELRPLPHKKDVLRVFIDGRFAWGTEGTDKIESPRAQISSIVVTLNGKTTALPKKAFSDCYDPHPNREGDDLWSLWVSRKKNLVSFKMLGSDAAAGYYAMWTVHTNGRWSRDVHFPEIE
jgi:hypothetical protein